MEQGTEVSFFFHSFNEAHKRLLKKKKLKMKTGRIRRVA
jgi:hypothetical protein